MKENWLIIICILIIIGLGGYIVYDKILKEDDNINKVDVNMTFGDNENKDNSQSNNSNDGNEESTYTIEFLEEYNNERDLNIHLMQVDSAIVIKFNEDINEFGIYKVEYEDDDFKEIEVLYDNVQTFKKGESAIIRTSIPDSTIPNLKISFRNKDGIQTDIIPTYSGQDGSVIFITEW